MKELEEFVEYCKQYIYDHIDGYRGQRIYLCDLGWTITEGPNYDGTLTYSRALALDYLREWVYDASDYFDYAKANLGEAQNPFENPEAYMVCMVIEGVKSLINEAVDSLEMDYNEQVELTGELIEQICEKVNEDDRVELF